ncbi:acyltransferase [Enterococcus florum]|uniref:Acyltransferase n=1 Tax=Enterococcus florum TaxID=2480627 RepID=A0A4P5P7A8_9ENTE|nr:acyltransferase family protein [Enterococcus florum]GCF93346.1 acyltransferase [Enterococcus florum]
MAQRDAYFDNAKLLLMILVVFGHLFQPFIETNALYNDLYYFIFTFHMPAFILISGYFAKGDPKPLKKLIKKLLLPYVFFQLIYSGYYTLIGLQESFDFSLTTPQWSLWFLLSLFCWNCLLHLRRFFTVRQLVIGSLLTALIVGYIPIFGRYLAVQRTLTFFPYFMVGYALPVQWVDKVKAKSQMLSKRTIALVLFALLFAFVQWNEWMNKYWVFGSKPYEDYLNHPIFGGPQRLIFFFLGLVGIAAFFLLVPRGRYFFSKWGKNTLTVYLLHGFLVKGLRALEIEHFEINTVEVIVLFGFSMLLTAGLSSERFRHWMDKVKRKFMRPALFN